MVKTITTFVSLFAFLTKVISETLLIIIYHEHAFQEWAGACMGGEGERKESREFYKKKQRWFHFSL
jgi:hypothetical protein